MAYDHRKIEEDAQKKWEATKLYRAQEDKKKPKKYVLDMFPYPSGEGLHVGHPKGYIATDIYSRFSRMRGYSVLHPMGWDAFGLPAENFAIKHKVHPREAVKRNIANFKAQLAHIGFDYDWSREIQTTDPRYYHWTQWIFLKMLEHGLAFQSDEPINWCPSCKTGLANEDLDGTACERCGTPVEKKKLPQWVLKITDYADRMLADLDTLDWPEHIKEAQRNWIGRSEGAELGFPLVGRDEKIMVFTTRPDTLYGATYLVLAPEHPLVSTLTAEARNAKEVRTYVAAAAKKTEVERGAEGKEKTGVRLESIMAVNPATKEEVPIFVADYVLSSYGTGAIMAVPAHDERDFDFAQKFNLPMRQVIQSGEDCYTGSGRLIHSGAFTGQDNETAKLAITESVGGRKVVRYKLHDWVFSRQRYWGEPIPVIHCAQCGVVPVPYEDLPVTLPEVDHYEPTGTGESPLAAIDSWVHTTCPKCGGAGKRETNTMPQWAGSSWYYLRFMDPENDHELVSSAAEKYWAPVDVYVGGDHAVRHLIYARFWHKFLYDIGVVSTSEPFARLEFLGFILAEDGRKMSKRFGNVINPDEVVAAYGADAFRTYEMFMGPFENTVAWSTDSIAGTARFIERVWNMQEKVIDEAHAALEPLLHKTIKKVSSDIEAFKFNTAVSQMMIFLNAVEKESAIGKRQMKIFLQLLAPFAPHVTEALWERIEAEGSIHLSKWPTYDESLIATQTVTLAVQINGKRRGEVRLAPDASKDDALAAARAIPAINNALSAGAPTRVIYVPGRILNIVV
ncbi:MAG: leucine--tRNA ligase [Parcubacteria group bacterium 21-54-25]|nr:MAG: leucine--tRNA ligase [Parcubacteria group bacterium 21-54-25]HQU07674.1 leucine--tRNA ligase [Candidatus Paceibacterota bacterium]